MLKIEVRKDDSHVIIVNEKYPSEVNCIDSSVIPDIGVDYVYLQWSDAVWYEKFYVDLNNNIQAFTEEQLAYIEDICTNWTQPLGQEGNPTVEQFRNTLKSKVLNKFNEDVTILGDNVPFHEMSSWAKQEAEARAYIAGSSSATPFIDALLVSRDLGETKLALADKIVLNADLYSEAFANLLGAFQSVSKRVEACTTMEELKELENDN